MLSLVPSTHPQASYPTLVGLIGVYMYICADMRTYIYIYINIYIYMHALYEWRLEIEGGDQHSITFRRFWKSFCDWREALGELWGQSKKNGKVSRGPRNLKILRNEIWDSVESLWAIKIAKQINQEIESRTFLFLYEYVTKNIQANCTHYQEIATMDRQRIINV